MVSIIQQRTSRRSPARVHVNADELTGYPDGASRQRSPVFPFPFRAMHEANERCLELLVNAARSTSAPPFSLVVALRALLRDSSPALRSRAAKRCCLLLDMEFSEPLWWRAVTNRPEISPRVGRSAEGFPRRSATPLARATLALAREAVHADFDAARVILGMHRDVAAIIRSLQHSDIERICDRQFRRLRPRWMDQPAIWRSLLLSARMEQPTLCRDFDLHALRLLVS